MKKRIIFIVLCIFSNILFAQNNDYISLLRDIDLYISSNFVSPFFTKDIKFLNDYYFGFGFKRDPFTNHIRFSNSGIILCNIDENIYSMDNGIIMEIGYNESGRFVLVKYNEIEVYYYGIEPININIGDSIEKKQIIGKIAPPYRSYGPAIILKIKYKDCYFDPYFLLYYIVLYRDL